MGRQFSSIPSRMYEGKNLRSKSAAEDKLEDFAKRIKELEDRLSQVNNSSSASAPVVVNSTGGVDINTLNNLMKDFLKKQDLQALIERIEKVEHESSEHD